VSFSSTFEVENAFDYVVLVFCSDSLCTNPGSMKWAEVYYGGYKYPTSAQYIEGYEWDWQSEKKYPDQFPRFDAPYTSTEPYMQIWFVSRRSNFDIHGPMPPMRGFTANWTVGACKACPPGTTAPAGSTSVGACVCAEGFYAL
jgi:hypothetical protein